VLIVDDDALILAALERQLCAAHEVTVADDPALALASIRAGASFDVILCDVLMPVMSGVQFHAELVRIAPWLAARTVLMTGGNARREAVALLEATCVPTLAKPFDGDVLRRMLDTISA
jgi:CheY-like chemotaxis protein